MYLIGGYSYDETTETLDIYNDVQWAGVGASGNIAGGWHETTPFSAERLGQAAAAYNHFIYVLGGGDGGAKFYNTVEYAEVGANGNITPAGWHTTSSLNLPRADLTAEATTIDGRAYLYAIAGVGSEGSGEEIDFVPFANVEYAEIYSNGSLGPWTVSPSEFATPRSSMTTTIVGGCIYVVGGFGKTALSDVQYSCLRPNGSLGPWTLSRNSMHDARFAAAMLVVPEDAFQGWSGRTQGPGSGPAKLIVLGGDTTGGSYLSEVESTTAFGRFGNTPWTVAPESASLPQGVLGPTGVLVHGRAYVLAA